MAINSVTFLCELFLFNKGRINCGESSIKISNVSHDNKHLYEFLTIK